MPRIVVVVCAVVFTDTLLFGALVPLIPQYADALDLTKSQAGLLLGAYGAGALIGGIPSGFLTARIGSKHAVVGGLALLGVTTILFGLSEDAAILGAARFGQGVSSVIAWTGALSLVTSETDRARRGELLGTVFSFAILGYIVGPIIGAVAELTSIRATFFTVATVAFLLALVASRLQLPVSGHPRTGRIRKALADPRFVGGLWITFIPAVFFGVLEILAPLSLDEAGWGAVAIAGVFVALGALEVAASPVIGRLSDRRGRNVPVRLALVGSCLVAAALAFATRPAALIPLMLLSAFTFSGFSTPGMALIADRAEHARIPESLAFGIMNTAWASGAMIGPSVGATLGHAFSDAVPYLLCAAMCAATYAAVARVRGRPGSVL